MRFPKMYISGAPIEQEGPCMVSYKLVKSPSFALALWRGLDKQNEQKLFFKFRKVEAKYREMCYFDKYRI